MSERIEPVYDNSPEDLNIEEFGIVDPYMQRVLSDARVMNERLDQDEVDDEGVAEMINELDRKWAHYMRSVMKLSGRVVVFGAFDVESGSYQKKQLYVDEVPLRSLGFDSHAANVIDDSYPEGKKRLYLLLKGSRDVFPEGLIDESFGYDIAVKADVDTVILEADVPHHEQALQWLESTAPQFTRELHERLNKTSSGSEALLALRAIDLKTIPNIEDEFTRQCIDVYVSSLISVDLTVPYVAKVRGLFYMYQEGMEELQPQVMDREVLAYLSDIKLICTKNTNIQEDWLLATGVSLMPADHRDDPSFATIPLDSFAEITSLRELHSS